MSSIRGRRKGMGKVEFLANRPQILELMAKGYSSTMIYEDLKENGLLTISFEQFWRYLTELKKKNVPHSSPLASRSSVPALPASTVPAPPEADSPALPPARATELPEKRGRKRGKNSTAQKDDIPAVIQVPEDFIPTPFPID